MTDIGGGWTEHVDPASNRKYWSHPSLAHPGTQWNDPRAVPPPPPPPAYASATAFQGQPVMMATVVDPAPRPARAVSVRTAKVEPAGVPRGAQPGGYWTEETYCGSTTCLVALLLCFIFWPAALCISFCPLDRKRVYKAPNGDLWLPNGSRWIVD